MPDRAMTALNPRRAHSRKPAPAAAALPSAGDGTQAIRRAASILKTIASATPLGLSLAEISRAENLAKSTAHRILKCLMDEDLVQHRPRSLRYQMGPLIYELGLAVPDSALEVARWRPAVEAVARRTGVTTYLMRRTGLEAVCLVKIEGHSKVRVIPVDVGQRRFLGVGAGATALLAALDPATTERYIKVIAPELQDYPHITAASLMEAVRLTRRTGAAISQGKVMQHSLGIGVAIPVVQDRPSLAISIAAHVSTVAEGDVARWTQIIKDEIAHTNRTIFVPDLERLPAAPTQDVFMSTTEEIR